MIHLLKNIECYCPNYIGKKDILITGEKIYKIVSPNSLRIDELIVNEIPCDNLIAFPGIIDGHVHITGGGGENGFSSRLPEISMDEILLAGVTTVVGLLGADNQTRCLKALLAKAKALEAEGITTFIYSGSYSIPVVTFTGDITSDMVLVDKVIGAGEVAISDHRSSHPDIKEMLSLAVKTHLGGLLSGKTALVHIHIGDGKAGLSLLDRMIEESDLPIELLLPTHVNRSPKILEQAIDYAKAGGNIDLTSGETSGIPVPDAIEILIENNVDMNKVTLSSDAGGSIPSGGAGRMDSLYNDLINSIRQKNISPEIILPLVTQNAAKRIGHYPRKGTLSAGGDADIMIVDKGYRLEKLYSLGKLMVDNGKVLEDAVNAQ